MIGIVNRYFYILLCKVPVFCRIHILRTVRNEVPLPIDIIRGIVGCQRMCIRYLSKTLVHDVQIVVKNILLVFLCVLLFFLFHNILDRKLNLKQLRLLLHLPIHVTTIQCAIPLVLVLLRNELQVQMLLRLVLVLVNRQNDKDIRMCEILNVLDLAHFERFNRLLGLEKFDFHFVRFKHN